MTAVTAAEIPPVPQSDAEATAKPSLIRWVIRRTPRVVDEKKTELVSAAGHVVRKSTGIVTRTVAKADVAAQQIVKEVKAVAVGTAKASVAISCLRVGGNLLLGRPLQAIAAVPSVLTGLGALMVLRNIEPREGDKPAVSNEQG